MGGVEQPYRRHREDPHGVDAGLRHQREIVLDRRGFGELRAVTLLREGTVGHASDKVLVSPGKKKLAVHAERTGPIGRFYRQRSRRNLVDFDRGHLGSSRGFAALTLLGGGDARTTGVNEFHSPLRLGGRPAERLATFRRKKPFSDDRATKLGARTRRQIAADKL